MLRAIASRRTPLVCTLLAFILGFAFLAQPRLLKPVAAFAGPTCNVISGYVYQDLNNNGIRDVGEGPLPVGSTLELRNSSNVVVATTTTDATGFYKFSADGTIDTTPKTITQTVSFPESNVPMRTMSVPKFDPTLGTLTSVQISKTASFSSTAGGENGDGAPATITLTVAGSFAVTAPGTPDLVMGVAPSPTLFTFNAAAFDGMLDFDGPSGKTFNLVISPPSPASQMTTLTLPNDLDLYCGTGNVTINANVVASILASGSGFTDTRLRTPSSAQVTVKYTYIPSNCLAAGNYKIIQTSPEPPGFVDGCESIGNAKIPNSDMTDFINVTLAGADLPNNNFGEVRTTDLQITKTDNQTTTMPGQPLTYQIVVTNNGPTAVTGAPVTDTMPASLTNAAWMCAGMNGGSCNPTNGTGNINATVDLPISAKVTFTVNATVSASASGTITNAATIAVPPGILDTNQSNNTATDTTDINTNTDLAITKTDGLTEITLNSLLTYTIVVTNNGPTAVTNATVADTLPPNLDAANAAWSCAATTGSSCAAPFGAGNLNTTVNLAVNGTVTFKVKAKVVSALPGVITNTATVAAPPNITDTNPANNAATDETRVRPEGPCSPLAPTADAPTTVRGFTTSGALPQGDLFLLPSSLRFTLLAPAAGGASFFVVGDAIPGGNPGFAGVPSSGFAASGPGTTTQFVSCLDSFRELTLVLASKGVTEGDTVRLFVQNPDGTGQTVLAAFKFEGGVFKVAQLDAGAALLVNGSVPAPVGTPLSLVMTLGDSQRTSPLTLTLSQAGARAGCFQLATEVTRAGGVGTTSVVLTNVNVNRNPIAGDAARPEAGLLGGLTGGYPTGAKCTAGCPPPCPLPPVCNERICFRTPDYYCGHSIPLSVKSVRIPQINFGNPVSVRVGASVSSTVLRYLGCGFYGFEAQSSVSRMLTRYYLAAQISIAADPQRPDPCKLELGCFVMPMGGMPNPLPVLLSNGVTITGSTNLLEFFKQTESAIIEGRTADAQALLGIYKMLGCGD